MFGLSHPGALAFFAIVPALVLAYLARERPRRVIVSSVMAFRALRGSRRERLSGIPHLDWTFFVELLILSLAVLAMAGPFLKRPVSAMAVVLDNSAAMQARTRDGQVRFDKARSELDTMLAHEDAAAMALYVTAPEPHQISSNLTIAEARAELSQIAVTDAPCDSSALAAMLTDLAADPHLAKVIYAGASALAPPAPPKIDAIAVGDPIENFAIGSFILSRDTFGSAALHARITVANFSTAARELQVEVKGDDRHLGTAKIALGPGETGVAEFPALPTASIYRAELTPADSFPLDNVAYAAAESVKNVSVLFVTPTAADSRGLDTIPGVTVRAISPDSFTPADLANIDLAIFEFSAPKELPPVNSMVVLPPNRDPVFSISASPVVNPQITGWSKTDPLTDSVNFRLISIGQGEVFGAHPWMAPVVNAPGGALLLEGERQGHRFVATGFNPFPYLGKQNLPMSILTLNMLGYLAGVGANSGGYRTGEPWMVPAGIDTVELPSGTKLPATPGTLFREVSAQGVYRLMGPGGAVSLRAVNLANLTVSDLAEGSALKIATSPSQAPASRAVEPLPLARYALMAILVLMIVEAVLIYRRRRTPMEST